MARLSPKAVKSTAIAPSSPHRTRANSCEGALDDLRPVSLGPAPSLWVENLSSIVQSSDTLQSKLQRRNSSRSSSQRSRGPSRSSSQRSSRRSHRSIEDSSDSEDDETHQLIASRSVTLPANATLANEAVEARAATLSPRKLKKKKKKDK